MDDVDYLLDGMLSRTGVRDVARGGYVQPCELMVSSGLQTHISNWQQRYEQAHFNGFSENDVATLDQQGQELVALILAENPNLRIGYFSNGLMKRVQL
nr:hypothetical protein [uncultured Sphingomonas sp.]